MSSIYIEVRSSEPCKSRLGEWIGAQVLWSEAMQMMCHLSMPRGQIFLHVREVDTRSSPSVIGFKPSVIGFKPSVIGLKPSVLGL